MTRKLNRKKIWYNCSKENRNEEKKKWKTFQFILRKKWKKNEKSLQKKTKVFKKGDGWRARKWENDLQSNAIMLVFSHSYSHLLTYKWEKNSRLFNLFFPKCAIKCFQSILCCHCYIVVAVVVFVFVGIQCW